MILSTLSLQRLHKWVGLVIALQFLLWAVSGAMMAMLDSARVAGGPAAAPAQAEPIDADAWPAIRQSLAGAEIDALVVEPLLGRTAVRIESGGKSFLFDAQSGEPLTIDGAAARRIAERANPDGASAATVTALDRLTLEVRDHALPIWRVDFADSQSSSYYVSATSGHVLERRNDSWRQWDFFWMLHNMDYWDRSSFNHPLIVVVGLAALWLSVTGFWLLFRTKWRSDLRAATRRSGIGPNRKG